MPQSRYRYLNTSVAKSAEDDWFNLFPLASSQTAADPWHVDTRSLPQGISRPPALSRAQPSSSESEDPQPVCYQPMLSNNINHRNIRLNFHKLRIPQLWRWCLAKPVPILPLRLLPPFRQRQNKSLSPFPFVVANVGDQPAPCSYRLCRVTFEISDLGRNFHARRPVSVARTNKPCVEALPHRLPIRIGEASD